ncbi:type II toxin-antitoxin system RelE/ParE family toxin [Rhizobium sp. 18055]|jgi:toxin ParE1/3/4|uniref:type II toxin-antitoxin system RelE/ParE family toxin n=1 Tax=Rhizobium sp. 18055 TaxID=2681403 RepID=UPI00135AACCF|nr:type II toxin-antitoxin system RelE/ParE family toxin [Rhizobium sp. 18055]
MVVRWTHQAAVDRQSIFEFIETADRRAAIALDHVFSRAALRLDLFPWMGRPGRVKGMREFVVHRHYLIAYDVNGETIRILRILHAAQQWPSAPEH